MQQEPIENVLLIVNKAYCGSLIQFAECINSGPSAFSRASRPIVTLQHLQLLFCGDRRYICHSESPACSPIAKVSRECILCVRSSLEKSRRVRQCCNKNTVEWVEDFLLCMWSPTLNNGLGTRSFEGWES